MALQDRTTLPFPTAENMALWSRQMVEMQQMLLHPSLLNEPHAPDPEVESKDDDDDLWDNLPV